MIERYLQKIKCYFGLHEYYGIHMWEILEKPLWDRCLPVGYDQTRKMIDSMDRYENECIHCKEYKGKYEANDR